MSGTTDLDIRVVPVHRMRRNDVVYHLVIGAPFGRYACDHGHRSEGAAQRCPVARRAVREATGGVR